MGYFQPFGILCLVIYLGYVRFCCEFLRIMIKKSTFECEREPLRILLKNVHNIQPEQHSDKIYHSYNNNYANMGDFVLLFQSPLSLHYISSQFLPTAVSTLSGTFRFTTDSISSRASSTTASTSEAGASNISSSWICNIICASSLSASIR